MKKKSAYIFGFLLSLSVYLVGCDKEDPEYNNIVADTESVVVTQDSETVFTIIEGNGNYRLNIADENIATASAIDNQIIVKGISYGHTTVTVKDWANKTLTLPVKVNHNGVVDLVLPIKSTSMYLGVIKDIKIFSGNEGYNVTSSDPDIVDVSLEDDVIILNSKALGDATITVTDKEQKSVDLEVSVLNQLMIDAKTTIDYMSVGQPVTITILNGNGGYTCSTDGSSSYINCKMSDDGSSVIINGLKRTRLNKTVTIRDQKGQSVNVGVIYIDEPYLETPSYRYLIRGSSSYQSLSTATTGEVLYSSEFNLSQFVIKTTGLFPSGFCIQFEGNLNVGSKTNAVLYKVSRNGIDKSVKYTAEDCKVDKVENGWYWISFMEPNCSVRSYFITK